MRDLISDFNFIKAIPNSIPKNAIPTPIDPDSGDGCDDFRVMSTEKCNIEKILFCTGETVKK